MLLCSDVIFSLKIWSRDWQQDDMASDEKSITVGGTELLTRSKRQGEQYMDVLGDMSDYLGNL